MQPEGFDLRLKLLYCLYKTINIKNKNVSKKLFNLEVNNCFSFKFDL